MDKGIKISIIIWDANVRESFHVINFFAKQDFPAEEFELIWVDFYRSNKQVKACIDAHPYFRLLTLNNPENKPWHLGVCMNQGVAASRGDLLILPDGDIVVEPDLLSYVWAQHQNRDDLILYFRRYDEPVIASCAESKSNIKHLEKYSLMNNPTNYAGCYSLLKKYETHPVFSGSGMQGKEMYYRLRNAGFSVKWDRDKKIYHPWHPNTGVSSENNEQRKFLRSLLPDYPWIDPYAGVDQSWISASRRRNLSFSANEKEVEHLLLRKPNIPKPNRAQSDYKSSPVRRAFSLFKLLRG